MIYCFDIDGTVCTDTNGNYDEALPFLNVIERLNALVMMGHTVYICTARGSTTGIDWRNFTEDQLQTWGVMHHGLYFDKPTADIYIDNKAVNASDWNLTPIILDDCSNQESVKCSPEVSCYLCGSTKLKIISREIRNALSEVWHCQVCDIAMLDWAKSVDLEEYYNSQYRRKRDPVLNSAGDYATLFESQVNLQQSRLNALKPYLSKSKKVLEIGCSTGHLLYHIKDLVGEVVGVDYDKKAAAFAGDRCSCAVYGGDFNEIGLEPGYFDVVCSVQTLEHVQDPIAFMLNLKNLAKKDGLIFVEVRNLYDPLISLYANKVYTKFYYHNAHIFYFSASSLQAVMKEAGIIGTVRFVQNYNFLNHVHWHSANKPQSTCGQGLGPNRLPLATNCSEEFRSEFDKMNECFDKEYKKLLARYEVTDNLAFFGRPA